jgi:oligopeptide/dipeptide ABC transporter ATP-binding protein
MALLEVRDLRVRFETHHGTVRAVDGVDLTLEPGETLGLVGESGSGKSVTNLALLGLIPSPPGVVEGSVRFEGEELLGRSDEELRRIRGNRMAMIFQDPMTSLNPLLTVGRQLTEVLELHKGLGRRAARARCAAALGEVGIPSPEERLDQYPHELSGGMRQRVMIAMALILSPQLIIADEPTTALDVTIQAQVFQLMLDLKAGDTSILLITHDMGVIWELCQRVIVMYASRIVESGPVDAIFANPRHPYTRGLLAATPSLREKGHRLPAIPGQVPSPRAYPPGCHFAERCRLADELCRAGKPSLELRTPQHAVACFHDGEHAARSTQ